jgi:general L-amino acid transport system permease protein
VDFNNKTNPFFRWCKENLFSNWINSVVSVVSFYLVVKYGYITLDWLVFSANWSMDRTQCTEGGACWTFIGVNFNKFMYGFYPEAERWRVNFILYVLLAFIVIFNVANAKLKRLAFAVFILGFPILVFVCLLGGVLGLEFVATDEWGGLMLTVVIAVVGIAGAFPLGVLLALGRRSQLPMIKTFCVFFIEIWRAVPLITVLVMASFIIPLFLSEGNDFDFLLRAIIGIILFQSAYLAEVIRSGLQAVPKGQYEAGSAVGLSYWQSMRKIVLPQALEISIPGIVNQFIALFKDTSLVIIIGLFDFLGIIKAASEDPEWLAKFEMEGYVFAIFVYWIFCYGMSLYSQRLENKLSVKSH